MSNATTQPATYRTPDGYTFTQSATGEWTDGDHTFNSLVELVEANGDDTARAIVACPAGRQLVEQYGVAALRPRDFDSGRCVMTARAADELEAIGCPPLALLLRHDQLDWGETEPADMAANNVATTHGHRIISAYRLDGELVVWLVTEADRSSTTILLPEEY